MSTQARAWVCTGPKRHINEALWESTPPPDRCLRCGQPLERYNPRRENNVVKVSTRPKGRDMMSL